MISFRKTSEILAFAVTAICLASSAVGDGRGRVGKSSTGNLNLDLEISEEIRAGFLQVTTSDEDESSELKTHISSSFGQGKRNALGANFALCIQSTGRGYFEVTTYSSTEPGMNMVHSEFGGSIPVNIVFGVTEQASMKYRSVSEECSLRTAIPVSVNLDEIYSDKARGRIQGKINLLVKSE